jgi:hypothetical protein
MGGFGECICSISERIEYERFPGSVLSQKLKMKIPGRNV